MPMLWCSTATLFSHGADGGDLYVCEPGALHFAPVHFLLSVRRGNETQFAGCLPPLSGYFFIFTRSEAIRRPQRLRMRKAFPEYEVLVGRGCITQLI